MKHPQSTLVSVITGRPKSTNPIFLNIFIVAENLQMVKKNWWRFYELYKIRFKVCGDLTKACGFSSNRSHRNESAQLTRTSRYAVKLIHLISESKELSQNMLKLDNALVHKVWSIKTWFARLLRQRIWVAWIEPWFQPHWRPMGWIKTLTVCQTSSPNINVSAH